MQTDPHGFKTFHFPIFALELVLTFHIDKVAVIKLYLQNLSFRTSQSDPVATLEAFH